MSKKTIKRAEHFLADSVFFDRDEARSEFWKRYDIVKNDDEGIFQVLVYYGLGGMGKTSLLHKLEEEIKQKDDNIISVYYDFNDGQDAVSALKKIVKELQNKYKFDFTIFNYAVFSYLLKCGETPQAPEVKNALDDIPGLRNAIKLLNALPAISTFSQSAEWLVDRMFDSIDYAKKKHAEKKIDLINNASKEKLHNEISNIFVNELNSNLEKIGNPVFVLMLDTYERLVNELSTIGTPLENDLWLRDDNEGVILQIDRLLCVISGRESLKWNKFDSDWDEDVINQFEIDTLDYDHSLLFLESQDITDPIIQQKIFSVTKGMPLYLDICIDTYKRVKECEKTVTPLIFDNRIEKLAQRLLQYMSDEEKEVLYLLSCLGKWEYDEFDLINKQLGENAIDKKVYNKVILLTFVKKEENIFFIHQTMQEIIIQYCDEEKLWAYINVMIDQLENENILSVKYYKYLYVISKICSLKKNNSMLSWWVNRIESDLEYYLESFCFTQFISIYELIANFTESYILNSLYLNFLLKSGRYNEALNYINIHINKSNNVADLKFCFTASFYYFINGIDDKALELRKYVYENILQKCGEEDNITIRAGLALAASYSRMGNYDLAIVLGDKCRQYLKKSENRYDSINSAARNQLGDSFFRIGDYNKALKIYQEVYEDRKQWLGIKNNSTMIAYNHIADCLTNLGKYEEALEIYREVKLIRKEILTINKPYSYEIDGTIYYSQDHPDTIIVDNNMSVCLMYMKKYDEAFLLLKEVVSKRRTTLSSGAPATMGALANLSMCEYYTGMKELAIKHITEAVTSLKKTF